MNRIAILFAFGGMLCGASAWATDKPAEKPGDKPDEFAAICNAYGEGYTHIPGTSTCIRVGGYVKMTIIGGRPARLDPSVMFSNGPAAPAK